jgi:cytosine/adenosine deaminase-related metal-dependent hydrolase
VVKLLYRAAHLNSWAAWKNIRSMLDNRATAQLTTLLCAAWVAPMDSAPIRNGAGAVSNGRIVAVGESKVLRQNYPGAVVEELPNAILMPALVNAHVHLELSDLRQGPPPTST